MNTSTTQPSTNCNKPQVDVTSTHFAQLAEEGLRKFRREDGRLIDPAHIPRLVEALSWIGDIRQLPAKVCDLATFGDIDPVLAEMFGITDITTTGFKQDGPPKDELVFLEGHGAVSQRFAHDRFDIEDGFPYPDELFDLIIFTEVLEHISRDPMHTLSEINRVTQPGGRLLLSTPNCASVRSVVNVVRGHHPYLWPPYSRDGHRDRHNREYTPLEVRQLIEAAGYEVERLECITARHRMESLPTRLARKLLTLGVSAFRRLLGGPARLGWDGELIFVLARKVSPVTDRYPACLYY